MPDIIYLDHNATTPCAPEVLQAMLPWLGACCGNPASPHLAGRQAHRAVEEARGLIAGLLHVREHELFFTSGATEGNNWICQGMASGDTAGRRKVLVSSIEHKSMLESARRLRKFGYEVTELPVTPDGVVDITAASELIDENTLLVAVHLANNEVGTVQPINELANIAHTQGAWMHCDAVQGLGKIAVELDELGVDSAVFSAHKVYGPKGVGLLYLRDGVKGWRWDTPVCGGGQERSIRPGTLNVPGIVGFGRASQMLQDELATITAHMATLQSSLESGLKKIYPEAVIHGAGVSRLPNTTNIAFPCLPSDILMENLPLICISDGAACNSGAVTSSHVLRSMAIDDNESKCSVRISTGKDSKLSDIEYLLSAIDTALAVLPRLS